MEEERVPEPIETEEKFESRPQWQIWAARLSLVLFVIFVIYQLMTIARGGL